MVDTFGNMVYSQDMEATQETTTMTTRRFTVEVIGTDARPNDLARDIVETLEDVRCGYIGNPDEHAIYGAAEVHVAIVEPDTRVTAIVVPDEVLNAIENDLGMAYESGSTVGDIIAGATGIGFGGHLWEFSDDEDAIYDLICDRVMGVDLPDIEAARVDYIRRLSDAMSAVTP